MKNLLVIFFVASLLVLASCNDDEKVIGPEGEAWKALLARGSNMSVLSLMNMPSGSISDQDIYQTANGETLPGKVTKILKNNSQLYLLMPDAYKIEIISDLNYKHIATIDYSANMLKPFDICFVNATTAYIAHGEDSVVSVFDTKNLKLADETIPVGRKPVAIAGSGNQVYTANLEDNTVSIIDSRLNRVTKTLVVNPDPVLIEASHDNQTIVVISAGQGKFDNLPASSAYVQFISVADAEIAHNIPLGIAGAEAETRIPIDMTISETDWAFIATQDVLFKIDLRYKDLVKFVSRYEYTGLQYHGRNKEIMMIRNEGDVKTLIRANQSTASRIWAKEIPSDVVTFFPQ